MLMASGSHRWATPASSILQVRKQVLGVKTLCPLRVTMVLAPPPTHLPKGRQALALGHIIPCVHQPVVGPGRGEQAAGVGVGGWGGRVVIPPLGTHQESRVPDPQGAA